MNSESTESIPPANPSPLSLSIPAIAWREWVRRLLVCNPFFLASAALLLFGVNRLSIDPGFLGDEIQNLLFNFSALQFYEGLLIATAIVLARRKVWYDSALLVVLENGLVLVPFMLISQAALIGEGLTWALTVGGGLVAAGRFASLRRWYPRFNLPARALWLGGGILAANVALPRVFRPLMEVDVANWAGPNLLAWFVALPLLAAGANLLPRPLRYGGLNPERHWLPLFIYGLWIAGSAVHVWSVAHICDLPFAWRLAAPLALVVAWTLVHRITDCGPDTSSRWRAVMLWLTLGTPLLAVSDAKLFFVLGALNTAGYLALRCVGPETFRALAKDLALASVALLIANVPLEWTGLWWPEVARRTALVLAATFYFVVLAFRSRLPVAGIAGALMVGLDCAGLAREAGMHVALQAGLSFLLIHSLRWEDVRHAGAKGCRYLAAALWVGDAWMWTHDGTGWLELGMTSGGAVLLLAAWGWDWWRSGSRGALLFPTVGGLTLLARPGNWFLHEASSGIIALAGSLLLFAIGVAVAWTRHRWEHRIEPESKP